MSDALKNAGATGAHGGEAGWEDSLSRESETLAQAAAAFCQDWTRRFGDGAFANPVFLKEYLRLIQDHSILAVMAGVHRKADPGPSARFEERFRRSIDGLIEGHPVFDPVSPSILHYLDLAVTQARTEKKNGLIVDPEPVARILKFARQLSDIPALSGFRQDLLGQFPSGDVPATSPAPSAGRLRPGYSFRQYEVVKLLGIGGFAEVYLAFHTVLKEHRAIKVFVSVPIHGPERERIRNAFNDEAQTQAKLKHENVVRVYEVDDHDGHLILIMEYVEGRNLRSLIEERKKEVTHLSPQEIIKIGLDVARGLAYAHSLKIIHRDLKPENILINQAGVAMITDFGLAKPLNDTGQRRTTRNGDLTGTPQYMAPEQVFSDTYDHRIDLYALGAVLYHMAYGEPVFHAKDVWAILAKQKSEQPVPLSTLREDFPEELDRIILKLLAKQPEDRYASAENLSRDLEACQAALPNLPRANRSRRRRRLTAALALSLVLAAGALVWSGWERVGRIFGPKESASDNLAALRPNAQPGVDVNATGENKDLPTKNDPGTDPHRASPTKEPAGKPADVSERKPEPPAKQIPFREQLLAAPPRAPEAQFVGKLVDLFTKHRTATRSRSYADLAKDIAALSGSAQPRTEFTGLEAAAAGDLARLAGDFVQARFQALARSRDEVRLKLGDGTTAQGIVDHVGDGSISLVGPTGTRSDVAYGNLAPEEFLNARTAPLAELAFQALSGDSVQALAAAVRLEKDEDKIVLWYPFLARLARLEIQDKLASALVDAVEPLAKGERGDNLSEKLPRYAAAVMLLELFASSEAAVASLFDHCAPEFEHSRVEREAAKFLLLGRFSKVLATFAGTRAHPLAAKLLHAAFVLDFESPVTEGSPRKVDQLIAGGGWSRYGWQLHPDEKTFEERQQFWPMDEDKDGCILRDPAGPRSLIMHRPHSKVPQGTVLRFGFEPMGEGAANGHWRLLVLASGGKDNYLRFDGKSVGLFRRFNLDPASKADPLQSATLPQAPAERKLRTYVLIPGEDGFHLFVDGDLVMTLPKNECILPTQLQVAVYGGRLYMKSVLVLTEGKK